MPTQLPNPKVRAKAPTGHEPAKGFPNPREVIIPATQATHRVNPNGGTICNIRPIPISAAAYDDENPTCPTCAAWLKAVRAHTYAQYGEPAAHGSSALEPETEAPPPARTQPPQMPPRRSETE